MSAKTILIVDDSPTQLAALRAFLAKANYQVITATNGLEGITKAYQDHPDLIIADIVMPELNGYLMCRLLKNDALTSPIPIILLTSLEHQQDRFWGLRAGADRYLTKDATDRMDLITQIEELTREPRVVAFASKGDYTASEELKKEGIKSRLIYLLDRLLFESTITAEIRNLANRFYHSEELIPEFLNLLSNVLDYSLAGVLVHGKENDFLLMDLRSQLSPACLEDAREQFLLLRPRDTAPLDLRLVLQGEDRVVEGGVPAGSLVSQLSIPLEIESETIGILAIFSTIPGIYRDRSTHILQMAANEFTHIARYLLKLEEIEALRKEFISMLTHDLRSPLTSIIGGLMYVMGSEGYQKWEEDNRELLRNALYSGNTLMSMISDLLDLYKFEAGNVQLFREAVDFKILIPRVTAQHKVIADQKGLYLRCTIDPDLPPFLGDRNRLERVLGNLLSNALKFTSKGGVAVQADFQPVTEQIAISVTDTGRGIPAEATAKIFRKFFQVEDAGTQTKGTGLGLAFCKQVVEAHGGEIEVTSQVGQGSTFRLLLPLTPPGKPHRSAQEEEASEPPF